MLELKEKLGAAVAGRSRAPGTPTSSRATRSSSSATRCSTPSARSPGSTPTCRSRSSVRRGAEEGGVTEATPVPRAGGRRRGGRARPLAPPAPARRLRRPGARSRSSSRSRSRRRSARGEALDHVLLVGPPGPRQDEPRASSSARSSASASARSPARRSSARATWPRSSPALEERDVLFVDEIHRLNRAIEEILYPALEDFRLDIIVGQGPAARTLTLDLPPFTLDRRDHAHRPADDAAARPLRDDVPARLLRARTSSALIVRRSARILGVAIDDDAADEIARRSRGTPRIANRILRRVRDVAEVRHAGRDHDRDRARGARAARGRRRGLERIDRELLRAIVEQVRRRARSGSPRSPSRSARSPTRSRTSTSRTCSSSASSSARRAAG